MLVLLLVALVAVLGWMVWTSRGEPRAAASCCHAAQWPPDDLTREPSPPEAAMESAGSVREQQ